MMDEISSRSFLVHQDLLARCSPLRLPAPWDFLEPGPDCCSPIACPDQVLAALDDRYGATLLESAGILDHSAHGDIRLQPALSNPTGAILGLRADPRQWPFGLVTARGLIGSSPSGIVPPLADAWTRQRLAETDLLFAPFRVLEAGLLRSLDLAVTLCPAFHRLGVEGLRQVDEAFSGRDYDVVEEEAVESHHRPALRPTLVLLAWTPLTVTAQISPLLSRAVQSLTLARRHLGLPFAGVAVWQPSKWELDNLRYRLGLRNTASIREWVLESTSDLQDIANCPTEDLSGPALENGSPADFTGIYVDLHQRLAADRVHGRITARTRLALNNYQEAVRAQLTGPLRDWALACKSPLIRNAGVELASLSELVHQLGPILHELQGRSLESLLQGGVDLFPSHLCAQYLQLQERFSRLLRDLAD